MFNPHAPTNSNTTISNCYRKHEAEKKRAYEQRILEVEHSTFTPLVFSATGGMAKQCSTFYKRLASRLAEKWEQPYSSTLCWVRCRLSFSLLRSAIQCIRGARSACGHASKPTPPIDLVSSEQGRRHGGGQGGQAPPSPPLTPSKLLLNSQRLPYTHSPFTLQTEKGGFAPVRRRSIWEVRLHYAARALHVCVIRGQSS